MTILNPVGETNVCIILLALNNSDNFCLWLLLDKQSTLKSPQMSISVDGLFRDEGHI